MNKKINWQKLKVKALFTMVLLSSSFFLTSCKDISFENYDKIKMGMEYGEVTGIIGKPDQCTAVLNMKNCVWTDEAKEIRLKFAGGQVVFTSSRGLGQ